MTILRYMFDEINIAAIEEMRRMWTGRRHSVMRAAMSQTVVIGMQRLKCFHVSIRFAVLQFD